MRHVFVETNWVFGWAAPAHHAVPAARELLERARRGELQLHLPSVCLVEARRAIRAKCEPRREADAIRAHMRLAGTARAERDVVLRVLSAFESAVRNETDDLDARLESLRGLSSAVEVFALGDAALQRSIGLSYLDLDLQPFDQSILAGILTRASELRAAGATDLSFCEADRDLQPWPGREVRSAELKRLYDEVGLWVYQDFTLSEPARPSGWTGDAEPA